MRIALGSALILLAVLGFWRSLPLWLSLLNLLLGSLFLLLRLSAHWQQQDTSISNQQDAPNPDAS
jgi:hypothetical protein